MPPIYIPDKLTEKIIKKLPTNYPLKNWINEAVKKQAKTDFNIEVKQ